MNVLSLGIPFFYTSLSIPNAYVVGIDTGVGGTLTGSIQVQDRLQYLGSQVYACRIFDPQRKQPLRYGWRLPLQ